jgi:hypothetical protein
MFHAAGQAQSQPKRLVDSYGNANRLPWQVLNHVSASRTAIASLPEREYLLLWQAPEFNQVCVNALNGEDALTPNPSPTLWERGAYTPLSHSVGEGGLGGEG